MIYSDANGDGLFNTDDRVLCGSSDPSYTFGLNLNAGYKNFDLSMMFTGVAGVKRMIDTNGFGGEWSGDDVHPNNIWLDAWTPDNKNAKMPRIAVSKTSNNLENSDFLVAGRQLCTFEECSVRLYTSQEYSEVMGY